MAGHVNTADEKQFFNKIDTYLTGEDRLQVYKAFEMARREHGDQIRKSGELFFTHPLTVAYYLSEYMLDAPAIIAALLHDVAEDTYVTIENIEKEFGEEVAQLVDGVTKLKDVSKGIVNGRPLSKKEVEEATLHKLLSAMTSDVRAVIIKLFDRLHNMRTIRAVPPHRQIYKAKETLSVYAPLANRLGIWKVKSELESLSLMVLDEESYNDIFKKRKKLIREQKLKFPQIHQQIQKTMMAAKLHVCDIHLAPENIYTLYREQQENPSIFQHLDKTMRLVVLLEDWQACYKALGYLHNLWKPVPGTFDDYIAFPRENLYRSLHTTVVHTDGEHLKLRLRTISMDKVSEVGVLAQWMYQGTSWFEAIEDRITTFYGNISDNINVEPQDPFTGVKAVVEDVFKEQIHVYTPQGMVVELVEGATPIDFAYAIHTGLGDQCYAAYVNGALHPLNEKLPNGSQVRIVKKLNAQPKRAWLDADLGYIKTNYALTHARRWFRRLSVEQAIEQGRELLQSELDMLGMPQTPHRQLADLFHYSDLNKFYHDLGRAELLPTMVVTRFLEQRWSQGPTRHLDKMIYSSQGEQFMIMNADNRELRRCGTCKPRPPEPILGYIRNDGGVTVHHKHCHTIPQHNNYGRILKLGWGDDDQRQARLMTIQVKVYDRPGLLYEITELLKNEGMNISYINTPPAPKGEAYVVCTLEIVRPRQFVRILHQVQALVNVIEVKTLNSNLTPDQHTPASSLYRPE